MAHASVLLVVLICGAAATPAAGLEPKSILSEDRPGRGAGRLRRKQSAFDMEDGCRPENRAKTSEMFADSFGLYAPTIKKPFSSMTRPAYLTIGEWHTNLLLFNFMAYVEKAARKDNFTVDIVHVALDKGSLEACEGLKKNWWKGFNLINLQCIGIEGWLPASFFEDTAFNANRVAGNMGIGSCPYNMIIWSKPYILKAAAEASPYGVFMIDTDVIIYHDLLKAAEEKLMSEPGKSIITGIEGIHAGRVNTGTVYVSKTVGSGMKLLDMWIEKDAAFLTDDHGDQAALQEVFSNKALKHQHWASFEGIVGECGIKGPMATHYNCLQNKQKVMGMKGDWSAPAQMTRKKSNLAAINRDTVSEDDPIQGKIAEMRSAGDWQEGSR